MRRPLIAFLLPLLAGALLAVPVYLIAAPGPAISIAVYVGQLGASLALIRAWTGAHAAGLTSLGTVGALAAGIGIALARSAVWLAVIPLERIELGPVILAGLAYALFVALAEELHFRGLVMGLLIPRIGARRGVVLAAALFALVHVGFGPQWLPLFAADGLVWGALRMRVGALFPVVLSHGLLNFLTSTVLIGPAVVDDAVAAIYLVSALAVDALVLATVAWVPRRVAERSVA